MSTALSEPNLYAVVLEDHDKLSFQFVKDIFSEVFKMEPEMCDAGLMQLKREGFFEISRLPLQFAEQKQAELQLVAKLAGVPAKCSIVKV